MQTILQQNSRFLRSYKKSVFILDADLHHFPLQRYIIIFETLRK